MYVLRSVSFVVCVLISESGWLRCQGKPTTGVEFSFKMMGHNCRWRPVGGGNVGHVEVTDKVNKKIYVDNDDLPEYKLRLDASLKTTTGRPITRLKIPLDGRPSTMGCVGIRNSHKHQPSFNFELFNIDFS